MRRTKGQQYPIIKYEMEEREFSPPLFVDKIPLDEDQEYEKPAFEISRIIVVKHVSINMNGEPTETPIAFFTTAFRQDAEAFMYKQRRALP